MKSSSAKCSTFFFQESIEQIQDKGTLVWQKSMRKRSWGLRPPQTQYGGAVAKKRKKS